ncbi:MAG: DUF4276 family protein [Chloroflexi bacterium]|nr:DUF4276 family protein [Chloroflexota bacterium]
MKIVLFVEGLTERKAVPQFLKRWLDSQTTRPVGIQPVRFEGWPELINDSPKKARMYLSSRDVIAVVALLDLYGPQIYPQHIDTASQRYDWAKHDLERKVGDARFFQFFVVHEVEAWLLSDQSIFPRDIAATVARLQRPEEVDFEEPPAKLLKRLYKASSGHAYKKVTQGQQLFKKLDPAIAYNQCPRLKDLLDKMLEVARQNGL